MYTHYTGLSAQQVADNRRQYGTNIISHPNRLSVWDKLKRVSSFWLIKALVILEFTLCFALLILDMSMLALSLSAAGILLIIAATILLTYCVAYMAGRWNETRNCYELNPMISILIIVLCISFSITLYQQLFLNQSTNYLEPLGITFAILISSGLAYLLERKNEKTFHSLQQLTDEQPVKVMRDDAIIQLARKDIVVGDIILFEKGDEVPADAELLEANNLLVDEASLTGQAECIKTIYPTEFDTEATISSNQVLRGSFILQGNGLARVFAVGNSTMAGETLRAATVDKHPSTPLQKQLNHMARTITIISYIVATLILIGRMSIYFGQSNITQTGDIGWISFVTYLLNTLLIVITFLVVTLPEGLPLAVSFSLAYTMRRLMKANTVPRTMHAYETIGATTIICIDTTTISTLDEQSIQTCQNAGIRLLLFTADNPNMASRQTAHSILWKDHLLPEHILLGTELEFMTDQELIHRIQQIKIISRVRPSDKERIINLLQQMGEVVAVTGNGNNDASALNAADIGIAMGQATDLAKDASDIMILNNSFQTITNAVMWGRSLYKNIQRFLIFQLTVNTVAGILLTVGIFTGTPEPLTVIQMLWVNVILICLTSIAFASLPPSPRTLRETPRPIHQPILKGMEKRIIIVSAIMATFLLFLLLVLQHMEITSLAHFQWKWARNNGLSPYELGIFFTFFVLVHHWNLFNERVFMTNQSVFQAVSWKKTPLFILIATAIFCGQIIIVETPLLQEMFSLPRGGLPLLDWLIIIAITSLTLWIGELRRWILRITNKTK